MIGIEIQEGSGVESGPWTMHNAAMGDIAQTIHDSCEMYNAAVDGLACMEDAERFLDISCRSYESG